jgi:cytochrome o ubiquinol oxidase subunit 1
MVLVISAFPVLTATTLLLWLDRFFDMHFFTTGSGGNQMMYTNLIWMWGHPEVYILIIPAFGVFSEIVSTFSQRRIVGYGSMVVALFLITAPSYLVWLHHFFTMGAGADVNAFFGFITLLIGIPSGVQVFNWILTMYKGKVIFHTPMYYFLGFGVLFLIGGMAGLFMASPPADFQVHNSLFLIAHFHTMIVGIALFGFFAAMNYWFPKIWGFKLDEKLGKRAFWLWFAGFFLSFMPLYILGFKGAARRLDHYASITEFQPLYITQIIQVVVSIKEREKNRDTTGDPWNGRSLEWSTPSPPPFYNFAIIPHVTTSDPFWHMKKEGLHPSKEYKDFHTPRNTGWGIYISVFAFLMSFGIVWHIYWLIFLGLIGVTVSVIILSFDEHMEYVLPASEIAKIEKEHGR